jgi:small subunit ribosomal protein S10
MKINCKLKISTSKLSSLYVFDKNIDNFELTFKKIVLPTKIKRFVFLKSPHVNKKSKEHFQLLYHKRLYYINFQTVKIFKEFLLKIPNDLNITLKFKS